MFYFFTKRYNAIIRMEEGLLNRARIAILVQLLCAFSGLSIFLFILYFFLEQNILLYRICLLMILFISGLCMIFIKIPWKKVGHYFLFCLTCFIWSNLMLLKNGVNIVTVQYVMMIVTGGYYILGSRWGLVYSFLNTMPVVLLFSLQQYYMVQLPYSTQNVNTYAYNFSIVFNFLLLIFIHYYFFRAFKRTSQKEQRLTANLKRSLSSARKVAEDKTNFLSTMSHELRTPLNAVIGITNVLLENDPKPEQKENLQILHFSAENLMVTINDILSFNRLDAGMEKLELTSFRLDDLLKNVYGALKLRSIEKRIEFLLEMDNDLKEISVYSDQSRLTQILFNLAGNAIKFTNEGFVKIVVELKKQEGKSLNIKFGISDSGIGIPSGQTSSIFEPYFRAQHGDNTQFNGTGLGLSIARRLVELCGGKLTFETQMGVGTTFNFELNLMRVSAPVNAVVMSSEDSAKKIGHLRILIVEDNPINVMVLQKTLQRWGLEADVAANGKLAVQAVENNRYDVVFMDINMPVMDGFEASRLIRMMEDGDKNSIYIIALTASIGISVEQHGGFQYLNDFLLKPFYPDDLKIKLEKVASLNANEASN